MYKILKDLDKQHNTRSQTINNITTVSLLKYSHIKQKDIVVAMYYFVYVQSALYPFTLYHNNKNNRGFHYQGRFKTMRSIYQYISQHLEKHIENHKPKLIDRKLMKV